MKGSKNNCNKKEILVWINDLLQVTLKSNDNNIIII